jgi:large subunit ribosomal protein L22
MKQYIASLKLIKGSHYKINALASLLRKKSVDYCSVQLTYINSGFSEKIKKLIMSCASNAKYLDNIDSSSLFLNKIDVSKAMTLKRYHPRGRGKGSRVEKFYTKIKITMSSYN